MQKFRSIEECGRPPRLTDPEQILSALAFVLSFTPALDFPRGLHKYRTIEEANDARRGRPGRT